MGIEEGLGALGKMFGGVVRFEWGIVGENAGEDADDIAIDDGGGEILGDRGDGGGGVGADAGE